MIDFEKARRQEATAKKAATVILELRKATPEQAEEILSGLKKPTRVLAEKLLAARDVIARDPKLLGAIPEALPDPTENLEDRLTYRAAAKRFLKCFSKPWASEHGAVIGVDTFLSTVPESMGEAFLVLMKSARKRGREEPDPKAKLLELAEDIDANLEATVGLIQDAMGVAEKPLASRIGEVALLASYLRTRVRFIRHAANGEADP